MDDTDSEYNDNEIDKNYIEEAENSTEEEEEEEREEGEKENINEDIEIEEEEGEKQQIQSEDHEHENEIENSSTYKKCSWVWSHFSYDNVVKKARCNLCKMLIITSKGSTTGMSTHLRTKHKITKNGNVKQKDPRQLTLQESIQNSSDIVSLIFYFF